MAIINNALGALLSSGMLSGTVQIQTPSAIPWEALIMSVFSFVTVYGWRIILFTLCLKLLLSPIDFFSRYKMRQNSKKTEAVKDKLEAIDRQFTDPLERMRARNAITKQAGVNQLVACLPMFVPMIVFIWMSFSMTSISRYMNMSQYLVWYNEYHISYDAAIDDGKSKEDATRIAQSAVEEFYKTHDNQDQFLWIKNIWVADVPWDKPIKTETGFNTAVKSVVNHPERFFELTIDDSGNETKRTLSGSEVNDIVSQYNLVTEQLQTSSANKVNGYLILVVLSAGVSFLSFKLMRRQQNGMGMGMAGMMPSPDITGGAMPGMNMKLMQYMMPAMYVVFAVINSSMFSIYMIASSTISIGLSLAINNILKLIDKRRDVKETTTIQRYGRPDPSELKNKKNDDKDSD